MASELASLPSLLGSSLFAGRCFSACLLMVERTGSWMDDVCLKSLFSPGGHGGGYRGMVSDQPWLQRLTITVPAPASELLFPRTDGQPWRKHDWRNWHRPG